MFKNDFNMARSIKNTILAFCFNNSVKFIT
jgi:hypothetical protein